LGNWKGLVFTAGIGGRGAMRQSPLLTEKWRFSGHCLFAWAASQTVDGK